MRRTIAFSGINTDTICGGCRLGSAVLIAFRTFRECLARAIRYAGGGAGFKLSGKVADRE
jgi:hypothetical protein